MRKINLKSILTVAVVLILSLACLTGCGQKYADNGAKLASGGVLCLRVNPEIAITYDAVGKVTKIDGRNDDGSRILDDYSGYEGKACRQVVTELVSTIGEAGYFVEEVEGKSRQITIEIESGSRLPHDTFLEEVVADVRECVNSNDWHSPVDVRGESDYGLTDYADTDYGPNNDGVTDYDDTDYGPNNDGVTDYDDTDYGPNNDGVTDYNDGTTDYNDGSSDYSSDDGDSNYDD